MNSSCALRVRPMTSGDLAFADAVRDQAGWNQTRADWDRFLQCAPAGCFCAEWDGARVGTATTTVYDGGLAWIGMVLVHPEYRRRGIGTALLRECLQSLQERGVRCVKLDATPAGRPVYEALGFRVEWSLTRWQRGTGAGPCERSLGQASLREWREEDGNRLAALDQRAFGGARCGLLQALLRQGLGSLVADPGAGRALAGYGLLRPGARAHYLGPVVAESPEIGLSLVAALTAAHGDRAIFWDLPDHHELARAWAQANGFVVQRTLTRMVCGEPADAAAVAGEPGLIMAIAGPEVG